MTNTQPTAPGGVFRLGGDLPVHRLGYGAMQITGPGVWGEPADPDGAIAVLRRAVELGVTFIDTADSYGPYVSEDLIRQALHPYPENVVIATKGGLVRTGPSEWVPVGRPAYLKQEVEMSLRRLGVERIDLYQLHRVDPEVPLADQVGALAELKDAGKIRHIGLSEVDAQQIKEAAAVTEIASVQNLYNLTDRHHEDVLDVATDMGIAFIPWFPIATGELAQPGSVLETAAREHDATPAQLALAWLLRRSPVMLPIPGTKSVAHLEENVAAADVELTDDEFASLSALGG
ncbi:aldo/keto reductase [Haloechinothrix salitolerans]|uniref:Aldo/keto reductase n=1 Tax=Haloechinothrix salitolerans TaxID=926830 RepID=A0ABW2C3U8_9PSEU